MTKRKQQKIYDYLDALKHSGKVKMLDVRPDIMREFGLDEKKAGEMLVFWMLDYKEKYNGN